MMKLNNTTPSQQRRYVKSATHNSSGPLAVKSRSTRSVGRRAAGSGLVVRHGRPRRREHCQFPQGAGPIFVLRGQRR